MAPSDRDLPGGFRHSGLLGPGGEPLPGSQTAAGDAAAGLGSRFDEAGNRLDPLAGFRSLITNQQALSQSIKEITSELRLAEDAIREFTVAVNRSRVYGMKDRGKGGRSRGDAPDPVELPDDQPRAGGQKSPRPKPEGAPGDSRPDDSARTGGRAPAQNQPRPGYFRPERARTHSLYGHFERDHAEPINSRSELRKRFAEAAHQVGGEGTMLSSTLLPVHGANGQIAHYEMVKPDGGRERIEKNDSRLPGLLKRSALQYGVSTAAKAFASGGLAAGARAVPVVGTAMYAAQEINQGLQWVGEQRKQNAFYQSIYGGSNFGTGVSNRLAEEGYAWSNRLNALNGGMTEEDSRAAFQGVSQLGFRGGRRDEALSMIQGTYRDLGVDVSTSLKLVEQSAKHSVQNLGGLTTALKGVGQMAVATGQNANVLYQAFANNYGMSLQQGFGNGSAAVAAGLTGSTSGASRDFADVDQSKLNTFTMHQRLAQQAGMPYSQLIAQNAAGNTAPYLNAVGQLNQQWASSILDNMPPAAKQAMQNRIQQAGGIDRVLKNDGAREQLAQDLLSSGVNIDQMMLQYTAASGEDVSGMDPGRFLGLMFNRANDPGAGQRNAAANQQKFNSRDLGDDDPNKRELKDLGLADVTGSQWVRDRVSTNPLVGSPFADFLGLGEEKSKNSALKAYTEQQQKDHQSHPVIESLIDTVGKQSEVGVEVQTGKGKQTVSLSDAITYYGDQLNTGKATVVGGDADGKTVSQLVGGADKNNTLPDSTGSTEDHGGMSAEDWKKEHPTEQSEAKEGQGGSVTISLQPQVAQFFQIQTTGIAKQEAGAQGAVPPVPSGGMPQ